MSHTCREILALSHVCSGAQRADTNIQMGFRHVKHAAKIARPDNGDSLFSWFGKEREKERGRERGREREREGERCLQYLESSVIIM